MNLLIPSLHVSSSSRPWAHGLRQSAANAAQEGEFKTAMTRIWRLQYEMISARVTVQYNREL